MCLPGLPSSLLLVHLGLNHFILYLCDQLHDAIHLHAKCFLAAWNSPRRRASLRLESTSELNSAHGVGLYYQTLGSQQLPILPWEPSLSFTPNPAENEVLNLRGRSWRLSSQTVAKVVRSCSPPPLTQGNIFHELKGGLRLWKMNLAVSGLTNAMIVRASRKVLSALFCVFFGGGVRWLDGQFCCYYLYLVTLAITAWYFSRILSAPKELTLQTQGTVAWGHTIASKCDT